MSASVTLRRSGARYLSWSASAACLGADVNLFFPPDGESTRKARALCAACPVRRQCGEHAATLPEHWGVWGGMNERERRKPPARTSAFPGVNWNKKARKWVARAVIDGRRVHLGTFADEAEAGRAAAAAGTAPQASSIPQPKEMAA